MAREKLNEFGLTGKQEKFAQAFVETGDASEAFRRAYDASNMNANSVNRKAHEAKNHVKISARIDQLRSKVAKRHDITVDTLLAKLDAVYDAAMDTGPGESPRPAQAAAATGAIMAQAKLLGLDKQLIEMSGSLNVTLSNSQRAALDKALDDEY